VRDFPYTLSAHAARVIAARRIELGWIARIVANPMKLESDPEDPELVHALGRIPEHGDRVLRVVYNNCRSPWSIVTAYFDRRERRRL
jgi:hypothetical protein